MLMKPGPITSDTCSLPSRWSLRVLTSGYGVSLVTSEKTTFAGTERVSPRRRRSCCVDLGEQPVDVRGRGRVRVGVQAGVAVSPVQGPGCCASVPAELSDGVGRPLGVGFGSPGGPPFHDGDGPAADGDFVADLVTGMCGYAILGVAADPGDVEIGNVGAHRSAAFCCGRSPPGRPANARSPHSSPA